MIAAAWMTVSPRIHKEARMHTLPVRLRRRKQTARAFLFLAGWVSVGLLATLPPSSWAAETPVDLTQLSLEDLMRVEIPSVTGASRYAQKVTEAPSSVSIVTAEEIKHYGYRTLADILRSVRGFFVTYDRNYNYLGVRGLGRPGDYNTRILLLVDGHRINDNIFDSASIGTEFPVDIDLIERVEVIRGSSSSLYGSNAFFAVINVLTRRGGAIRALEGSGEAGSYSTYKGRLTYGSAFANGLEVLGSGTYYHSEGQNLYFREFDTPATNDGQATRVDGDQFGSVFSRASFRGFSLEGAYTSRKKEVPTASFGTIFDDRRNRARDDRGYLDLQYSRVFANELDLFARIFYDYAAFHGNYMYDYPPVTLNRDLTTGQWWGSELKLTKTLFTRHKLSLGGEFRDNFQQDLSNFDESPYTSYLDERRNSTVWAVYAQDEFAILDNLILNAGVRYDYYSTFGGTVNPRVGLIYNPFERSALKLLYGQAFRAPNAYELFYHGAGNEANPHLKPETIRTYELVWEQYLGRHVRGTAAAFYYTIKDLISEKVDPDTALLIYQNGGHVDAKGLEFELEGTWANGWAGRLSYTVQQATDADTGMVLTNSSEHLVKGNLTIPLYRDWLYLGIEEQFASRRKTLADRSADAFFLTNLTLFSQHILRGLEVSASVYNLFNSRYSDPGSEEHVQDLLRQDGRTFRLKLTYRF